MPEPIRGLSATRAAFLELNDERRFVQEGFEFLDEKRMLMAAELLRQLDDYQQIYAEYYRVNERAMSELKRSVHRHGLDGLTVYPEANSCAATFQSLLGIAAQLAAISGNIYRLCHEYTRTEHRARALENVVIPEIDATLKVIGEQLENVDQEDVLRVQYRK
jgi:V/A-type H+-transporting ATPase subunit D